MNKLPIILSTALCLCSCGNNVSTDTPPQQQAVALAQSNTPEKAASSLINWLVSADTADREFSRTLSANILLFSYKIGSPESERIVVTAFDSISERLSAAKRAHIILALNSPSKAASIVARKKSDEQLINEMKLLLEGDSVQLEQFNVTLEVAQKQIKRLENENSEPIRSDD
ncbi:MAG: hypothetical protein K2K52_01795 [Paramuribaculum sp.]|nr:hypothetical protein [Paramuribaculum sp.]